jgi:integrase
MDASVGLVLQFLQNRFDLGRQASTIKSYVSALGHFLPRFDGQSLGCHPNIKLFLKGVRRLRPPTRVTVPPWDLSLVLGFLNGPPFEPLASASLEDCSIKTAFLVAITSSARASELAALDCRPAFTKVRGHFATLKHNDAFQPKVPSSVNTERTINLQADKSRSCPVRALSHYLRKSAEVRQPPLTQLFVTFATGRQGRKVQPATISRWLVTAIKRAYAADGQVAPQVTGHSTRKMATSKAWAAGASCEEICLAATWASGLTFAQFYKLDMLPQHLSSISARVLSGEVADESESDSD